MKSISPALVENYWAWHWMYWLAPVAGGIAAGLVYHHLILEKKA